MALAMAQGQGRSVIRWSGDVCASCCCWTSSNLILYTSKTSHIPAASAAAAARRNDLPAPLGFVRERTNLRRERERERERKKNQVVMDTRLPVASLYTVNGELWSTAASSLSCCCCCCCFCWEKPRRRRDKETLRERWRGEAIRLTNNVSPSLA